MCGALLRVFFVSRILKLSLLRRFKAYSRIELIVQQALKKGYYNKNTSVIISHFDSFPRRFEFDERIDIFAFQEFYF